MNTQTNIATPLLSANQINVYRSGRHILQNVSLDIADHDFVTVIGPNGAGKSMLLKCLLGLYKPDSGQINGTKNLRIGYVPQRLIPERSIPITVSRFLSLRRNRRGKKGEDNQTNDQVSQQQVSAETRIEHMLSRPIHVLSGGEFQRVLLARALLENPSLLILDEPAQNLDFSGQLQFYKLLEKIYEERKLSILMVSHDLHMVMSSTKRVICLFRHICCSGTPNVVTQDPEFVSLFGHDMAKMMAVYHHHHDHDHEHIHGHNHPQDHTRVHNREHSNGDTTRLNISEPNDHQKTDSKK